jgi:Protein of unknown function (DUF3224)
MAHAAGTFTVASWDENTYQELTEAAKLTKASVAFGLEGDINGKATWEALMYYRPDGTAAYTGIQMVSGRLGGVEGTFAVFAEGEYAAGEARSRWQVIEGSGTGGLSGLIGSGSAVATASPQGTFTLDYELV